MAVNSNFNTLTATTLKNYKKTMTDNIFTANPLFYWLKEKDRLKIDNSGGEQIIVPLMYGMNSTAKSYSGYDVITITPQDGMSAAEFDWKQYAAGISISGAEEFKNSGEGRLINLLEQKIKQAELTLIDKFAEHLFQTSAATNDIGSLYDYVSDDGSGTVGGIVSGTYTWWKNYYVSGASTSVVFENIIPKVFDGILNASKGNDTPDIGIMPSAVFLPFESQLVKTMNFLPGMKNQKAADIGFDNYKIKGTTIMYDENCTSAQIYLLNSRYISLVTGAGKDFVSTDWIKPDDGDYKSSMILWYGNLVVSNRARQAKVVTIT